MTDGYSTAGGLGIGLGTVNRLMDDLEFHARPDRGLLIVCQRWLRPEGGGLCAERLIFGAATRPCRMLRENADRDVYGPMSTSHAPQASDHSHRGERGYASAMP